jgi:hypothetical protein
VEVFVCFGQVGELAIVGVILHLKRAPAAAGASYPIHFLFYLFEILALCSCRGKSVSVIHDRKYVNATVLLASAQLSKFL